MDAETRQSKPGAISRAAGRGAAICATFGLALGLVELALGALVGEAVFVERAATHPLPYVFVGALLGAFLGPLAALIDVALRRLGRERPRSGLLVPLCMGVCGAGYAFAAVHGAGAPWKAAGTGVFWAVMGMVALGLAATWPIRKAAPAAGWAGYPRAAEIALAAVLSLASVTMWGYRSGWVQEATTVELAAVVYAICLHPVGLGVALAVEALLASRLSRWRWLRPAPAIAAALAVLAMIAPRSSAGSRSAAPAPNVVLISVDGARVDSFSLGDARNPTPGYAAVARAGAVFERARTPSSWCLPGHVALLTGSQASASGVTGEAVGEFRPERRRRSSPRTLAERLAARGYETVAFSNNPWVSDVTGLDAGFARFYAMATPRHFFLGVSRLLGRLRADPVEADDGATITAGAAARWVERHRDRPFFLFVNLIEAMPPWTPPNPFRDRALDGTKISDRTALRRAVLDPLAYSLGAVALDWRDTDLMRQLYDAEVAAADAAVAALLESLQRAGVLDRTVVVVTADHGFAFDSGTHYAGNKLTLSEGVLRVPLVIRGPGIASGKSLDVPVSTLDVVPTLMELAGAPPDRQAHGRSLVPLLRAEQVIAEFEGRPLIAEHRSPRFHLEAIKTVAPHLELDSLDRDQFAVVVGSRKLRFDSKGKSAVHDLEADPDEGNAAWADSEEGRIAARELKETYEAWRASHPPAPRAFDAARDAATMRVLNALPFSWLL